MAVFPCFADLADFHTVTTDATRLGKPKDRVRNPPSVPRLPSQLSSVRNNAVHDLRPPTRPVAGARHRELAETFGGELRSAQPAVSPCSFVNKVRAHPEGMLAWIGPEEGNLDRMFPLGNPPAIPSLQLRQRPSGPEPFHRGLNKLLH